MAYRNSYIIKIVVKMLIGRKSTLVIAVMLAFLTGLQAQVTCSFTASSQSGCPPLVVNFTDHSTGGPTSEYWDFDNGDTTSITDPTASFPNPGIYNVLHIVSNGSSTDSMFMQIKVFQPPIDSFTSFDNIGCNTPCHMVDFTNLTIPGESPIFNYVWDFGDGSQPVSGYNVSHCYSQTGSFQVTLVSKDSDGCQTSKIIPNFVVIKAGPKANLSVSPDRSCTSPLNVTFTGSGSSPNGPVSYEMFYGNGNTSAQPNSTQTYTTGIYNPYLIVSDTIGCVDTATVQVDVIVIQPGFTASTTDACTGTTVSFTDTSNFASSWLWDFGDGTGSTQQNPNHSYSNTGNYTVTLTVGFDSCTASVSYTNYITVNTGVSYTISGSPTSSCTAPLTVNFTTTAVGVTGYTWNFGDGTGAVGTTATHTYTSPGTYSVSLAVVSPSGCINLVTDTDLINIGAPTGTIYVDSNHGCAPITLQFSDSINSNSPITSYQWSFGDGGTSNQKSPSHTFAGGVYLPQLIITNANGCSDTIVSQDSIKVGNTLVPNFVANPTVQCADQTISFTNETQDTSSETTYQWQFGDGQTSNLRNPTHSYSDTGSFNITLVVTNQGCPSDTERLKYIEIVVPKAIFSSQFSCANPTAVTFIDSSQGAQTWLWEFGDGTTSTLQNPGVHTYPAQGNYTVTLIVTNSTTGCVDSTQEPLLVGTPLAAFGSNVTSGCEPLTVLFKDSSSYASSWKWIFGDGATSTTQNPGHQYTDTGQFTVTLIINPGAACSDTIVKVNYITVYGIEGKIGTSPPIGCIPLTVHFSDSTGAYHATEVAWQWDINGDTTSAENPSFVFDTTGTFPVSLIVTDSHGCKNTFFKTVSAIKVVPGFTADTAACPGESVQFTNWSLNGNSYIWSFGDGDTSHQMNPSHAYNTSGIYSVTLVVISNFGCMDTLVEPNLVNVDTPNVSFYVTSSFSPCPPFPVQFFNTTTRQGLNWYWQFGDGDTSTAFQPMHVYFFPGSYNVTLTATDSFGCKSTKEYIDMINIRGPIGHFTATPPVGCVPLTVSFAATGLVNVASEIADMGDGTTFADSFNITHTYTQPGDYYPVYTLTDSFGCTVAYPVDTIVVGYIPYPNLPPDTLVCKGNYVQFDLPLGDHFQWSASSNPDYLSCDTCKNTLSTSPDTITYYVTATTNIGCTASDTITVNVDALPQIFPGLDYRICPSDTLQLYAGTNVTSATWTPDVDISNPNAVDPQVWPTDTTVYRVTGGNAAGCTVSRVVTIWPIHKVLASVGFQDTLVCDGSLVPIDVTVEQASVKDTSFQWTPGKYLNSTITPDVTVIAPPGQYNYQVIVRSSGCIPDTQDVKITVSSVPDLEAGDNQTVAVGTTVQLYAASHQDVTYTWTSGADSLSCSDCRRPFVKVDQDETVYVVAENQYGCKVEDSVLLRAVGCDSKMVFVPNTFTPNGDGVNDVLYVRGIGLSKLEYFRVFDRWGNVVFQSEDMTQGWDGNWNGRPADINTYVYILRGVCTSGATVDLSGNVTLVR